MTNLPGKIAQILSNQNREPPNSSGYTTDTQSPEKPMRLSIMAQSDAHLGPNLSRIRPAGSPIHNPKFAKEITSSTEIKACWKLVAEKKYDTSHCRSMKEMPPLTLLL